MRFASISIYFSLWMREKMAELNGKNEDLLNLWANSMFRWHNRHDGSLIFHFMLTQWTMSMTTVYYHFYNLHSNITRIPSVCLNVMLSSDARNGAFHLRDLFKRVNFIVNLIFYGNNRILDSRLRKSVCECVVFCLRQQIRLNFNLVNGLAVNSQATFVVYRHCSLAGEDCRAIQTRYNDNVQASHCHPEQSTKN